MQVERMPPTLLLAVDFDSSTASAIAQEVCQRIALRLKANVLLLHAMPVVMTESEGKAQAFEASKLTSQWAKPLVNAGIHVEIALHAGPPAQVILEEAERRDVAMIVMGTAGNSGMKRWIIGSVAKGVLKESRIPVLVTPVRMHKAQQPVAAGETIVAAVDFSSDSEAASEAAGRLAKDLGTALRLVHVIDAWPYSDPNLHLPPEMMERDEDQAAADMAMLAARMAKHGVKPTPVVHIGHPATAIVAEAKACNAALIVVGTHGKSKLRKFLLGSVAQGIVQAADRPVLVVPDPAGEETGTWWR